MSEQNSDQSADTPMGQAPKPISNVVIYVSGAIIVVAVIGIVALMVLRPDANNLIVITSIVTMVGAAIAAFIGITNKQDIQVIHKAVNSQYTKWVKESNEAARVAATLAAERVATAERDSIAKIVREENALLAAQVKEETASMALRVKEETASVAAAAAAAAMVQQSEQRQVIHDVSKQATEMALSTPPPPPPTTLSAETFDTIKDTIATVDSAIQAAESAKRELGNK